MIISIQDYFGDKTNEYINKLGFWNKIIGSSFEYNYLKYIFNEYNKIILYVIKNKIHGVLVYGRINTCPYRESIIGLWEVKLLAKSINCNIPGIGKELMYWLEKQKDVKRLMLIDRCTIPDYYYNLGYRQIKNRKFFKKLLKINITLDVYYKCVKNKKKKNKHNNNVIRDGKNKSSTQQNTC